MRIGPEHAEAFYTALDDATPVPQLQQLADRPEPDLPAVSRLCTTGSPTTH